jgi:hypothetical protein
MFRNGMLDKGLTPAVLLRARRQTWEPCVVGKMRAPLPVGVLHRDLGDLPQGYYGTVIDDATRYARVFLLARKSNNATEVCKQIA